ncbi:MAG: cell division protein FtsW [Lachnospiraceae bacterium]|nr:cell division protein FtsW [Lachnospiraceae bacterium]
MIYSASSYEAMLKMGDPQFYLKRQVRNVIVAIVAMVIFSRMDYHLWVKFSIGAYIAAIVTVGLVVTPLGFEVNGARRWINLGPISFQPAEIAKIAVILGTALMITRMKKEEIETPLGMLKVMTPAGIMAVAVFLLTSNASSAFIIGMIAVVMLFVACKNYRFFVLGALAVIIMGALLVYLIHTQSIPAMSFRFSRINAWLNPEADAKGYGFQTLQSLYSIGSGGLWGKGLGQSMQKLGIIPEAQNDMIFSIICEELGFFGAVVVLSMFMFLLWRCLLVAQNAPDIYGSLITVGVLAHISLQVIMNVAVVTNTMPNTGVTLPFISYGGTSVVFLLIEIGMILNISGRIVFE